MIWSRMIPKAKILGKLALVAAAITALNPGSASAAAPFAVSGLVLYQPNGMLVARLGNDVRPLGNYLKQIEMREAALFANAGPHRGVTGAIVIAIKPGRQSRAWLVLGPNVQLDPTPAHITAEAEGVPPLSVQAGPVAVAILFTAWGGGLPIIDAAHSAPIPLEWHGGAKLELVPDAVLARIWP